MCTKREPVVATIMKLLFLCVLRSVVASEKNPAIAFQKSNEKFTCHFMTEVFKNRSAANYIMSAYSVLPPLGQLYMGAFGNTRSEIMKTIHYKDKQVLAEAFTLAIEQADTISGVTLKLANKLYLAKGVTLNKRFELGSEKIFKSKVENIDFTQRDVAAKTMNTWVERQTNGKIKDLINPSTLTSSTKLVLVNSIYFKGLWENPFKPQYTKMQPFHISASKNVMVPTMLTTNTFHYAESPELGATLLQLDFEKKESNLLIVLPNKVDGLYPLLDKLKDYRILQRAVDRMSPAQVEVSLPKFKIETTTNLKTVLENMGIKDLFTPEADLRSMTYDRTTKLYIGAAIQKAFIEVNENGTEAAAANVFVGVYSARPQKKIIVQVNKPFYFELRADDSPLFSGILGDIGVPAKRCNVMELIRSFFDAENCMINFDIQV